MEIKKEAGFSLVELIVAVILLVVIFFIISGIAGLFSDSEENASNDNLTQSEEKMVNENRPH